ncbi:Hypothetical predicted protein [Podarcis lilfordi]|uniref:Uncharacterized protein n=1 Tax=Podarcis lilfordi TaxID=74358 RepID=A0AA35LCT7_9SAUR|nr:Hypothetical predicted protein [Podarcis lilfordi]
MEQQLTGMEQLQADCVRGSLERKVLLHAPCLMRCHRALNVTQLLQGTQVEGMSKEIQSVDGQLKGCGCEELQSVTEGKKEGTSLETVG